MLRYRIEPDPLHRLYRLTLLCSVADAPDGMLVAASWTPGSYLMREYAGRFRRLEARSNGTSLLVNPLSKNAWQIDTSSLSPASQIEVAWSVHADSLGIHDAFISNERGFVNPAAVLVAPKRALADSRSPVRIDWSSNRMRIFSSLNSVGPNSFEAPCFEALVDSPFALVNDSCGKHVSLEVEACGIPHSILFTGVSSINKDRLAADLQKIFETTIRFWDPAGAQAPFKRYLLQANLVPKCYGGLEHAEGAVLLHDPDALPAAGEETPPKSYADFLVLAQHEYFHAWLVRRLKPKAFEPFDLSCEAYVKSLWLYEGFTSYYESELAKRAGVISDAEQLKSFAERLNAAFGREGFDQLSLEEASFFAWTKLYRPTADSPYSQTSYYSKGAAAAFILDMALRREGCGTLADALADLFADKRDAIAERRDPGLADDEFIKHIAARSAACAALLTKLVRGWSDRGFWEKSLAEALHQARLAAQPDEAICVSQRLAGLNVKTNSAGRLVCGYIPSDSPAFSCGLYQGDELIAVDGERAEAGRIDRQIERLQGRSAAVHWFRHDRLHEGILDLQSPLSASFTGRLPIKLVRI